MAGGSAVQTALARTVAHAQFAYDRRRGHIYEKGATELSPPPSSATNARAHTNTTARARRNDACCAPRGDVARSPCSLSTTHRERRSSASSTLMMTLSCIQAVWSMLEEAGAPSASVIIIVSCGAREGFEPPSPAPFLPSACSAGARSPPAASYSCCAYDGVEAALSELPTAGFVLSKRCLRDLLDCCSCDRLIELQRALRRESAAALLMNIKSSCAMYRTNQGGTLCQNGGSIFLLRSGQSAGAACRRHSCRTKCCFEHPQNSSL